MFRRQIEAPEFGSQGKSLEEFMDMAVSDVKVVAILHNPLKQAAIFLSHLEGIASPPSKSWPSYVRWDSSNPQTWPLYIRKDLLDRSWGVGSLVKISNKGITMVLNNNCNLYNKTRF